MGESDDREKQIASDTLDTLLQAAQKRIEGRMGFIAENYGVIRVVSTTGSNSARMPCRTLLGVEVDSPDHLMFSILSR